ncbi:hypothetical protein HanIR_Chr10g0477071 [Helianthus annuus]|nr:hypothetical protein HanIR_Chr10g0477071 [Helianthus annuus]
MEEKKWRNQHSTKKIKEATSGNTVAYGSGRRLRHSNMCQYLRRSPVYRCRKETLGAIAYG